MPATPGASIAERAEVPGEPDFPEYKFMKYQYKEDYQKVLIRGLVQTYLSTFRSLGIQVRAYLNQYPTQPFSNYLKTDLAHAWKFIGMVVWPLKIMPWDLDADVQITEADMYFLAAYHNMSTYYFENEEIPEGRLFLLEINPHYKLRETKDRQNVIDARWIDTSSGLYIDITAARYAIGHEKGEGVLFDKNGHEYRDTYLYPLRDTTFEGVSVKIPYSYKEMLAAEYGEKALTNKFFNDHTYDENQEQWVLAAQPDW
ncbi:unnamed protein product [Clonostachys rosea f. rosea IK726]|uniref:Uncharacterized protein n=1 Tax=Clonostachys rosea f. rosea IK726 TaxID=1349383 RepID=A0ACA9T6Q3_BIOOC|nr:unnamed protein product [Clonostachys rosea f. rosea IK726]